MKCLQTCRGLKIACPNEDCRLWLDREDELNCVLETIKKNGCMSLREVAERLDISFVRVKQIQDAAVKKLGRIVKEETI
tara:strand:- start:270 stop:506 length:237 start_codon:yes stop_codon:yes gene_type:complete